MGGGVGSGGPFAVGSVSLRMYPSGAPDAVEVVAELCAQAGLALAGGFDGVMTSEHHGGVGGYLPNPLQLAGFLLDEADKGWAAPCPILLPLRPTALIAEEVAWLAARHPGRVGLGVGSGALPLDFEVMELDVAQAGSVFKTRLPRLVEMLQGRGLGGIEGDLALLRCRDHPVTVLSAAVSSVAARRAAVCGAGLILEGMSDVAKLSRLCRVYRGAGGTRPIVVVRRVWLGAPQTPQIQGQRAFYQAIQGSDQPLPADQTVQTDDPGEMAERLAEVVRVSGADALNLRVHLPGVAPSAIRDQIGRLAAEVLPELRRRLVPGA
ncbi:MAG: LLM class flavin-dependent oxidoreductase [Acidobacteriota bacterium]|nr:LLM class flavin-dependent oxidoreductase [Acidobacteriota bacterium]